MKVGDLVELSQHGSRAHWRKNLIGLRGIVTNYRPIAQFWVVSWFRKSGNVAVRPMPRREIKHIRVPKK